MILIAVCDSWPLTSYYSSRFSDNRDGDRLYRSQIILQRRVLYRFLGFLFGAANDKKFCQKTKIHWVDDLLTKLLDGGSDQIVSDLVFVDLSH